MDPLLEGRHGNRISLAPLGFFRLLPTLTGSDLPKSELLCGISRSCPSEIILLVWRVVPQIKPGPDGGVLRRASCKSTHDLLSPPNKREKNCTHGAPTRPEQRHSCHLVCDSSDGLLLGGWERYTEVGKRSGQHTLPALSRAATPTDPNYIILAPLNPGSQVWIAECGRVLGPCGRLGCLQNGKLDCETCVAWLLGSYHSRDPWNALWNKLL